MLPMGTIITVCMLVALLAAAPYSVINTLKPLPRWAALPIGFCVFIAGAWNVFWYAAQHISEYWGVAALLSGVLLMITAGFIVNLKRMPALLTRYRAIVLLALLGFMLHYGLTIYRL